VRSEDSRSSSFQAGFLSHAVMDLVLDRGFVFVAWGVFAKLVSPANDASGFTDKIACQEQSRRANSPGDDKQSAAHDDSCFLLISIRCPQSRFPSS
jgi:hypothetical protein